MDALQGRPKAENITTVSELREWTLDARDTLLRGYAEGHSQRNLAAMKWLRDHGNRLPMLWGATNFEPYRPPAPYVPTHQDFIAMANSILAWCDKREHSADAVHSPEDLRKLADTIDEAKREIILVRQQTIRPEHLAIRLQRAGVQAARAVSAAVDLGCRDVWPVGWWYLSALRDPDNAERPPVTMSGSSGWSVQVHAIKLASGCKPDGTLNDDTALALWDQSICPYLRKRATASKGGAGAFDIPNAKIDDDGRILGGDGEPLQRVESIDPETGEIG